MVLGAIFVVVNNLDQLLLSKFLTLEDFAAFSLALTVAGGIGQTINPITSAVQPRLVNYFSRGDQAGMIDLYRRATQVVAAFSFSSSLILAFYANGVLWAWTGNPSLSASTLSLYAIGNGVVGFNILCYSLQYARGNLKWHLIGHCILLALIIPAMIVASIHWGALGVGWVWVLINSAYFLLWVPYVHRKMCPGLHVKWFFSDILPIVLVTTATVFAYRSLDLPAVTRFGEAAIIFSASVIAVAAGALASPVLRGYARIKSR
jgi:O-antigen/teichoic acid export membrane protein